MPADNYYVWIRFRAKSSAGVGSWEWREIAVDGRVTPRKLNAYLSDAASVIHDELNTHSEHWRGIDWERRNPPRHIVEAELNDVNVRIRGLNKAKDRLVASVAEAPEIDIKASTKTPCREWPNCGCMKQGRSKDCRLPHAMVMAKIKADRERAATKNKR